jgi:hypothetical protein
MSSNGAVVGPAFSSAHVWMSAASDRGGFSRCFRASAPGASATPGGAAASADQLGKRVKRSEPAFIVSVYPGDTWEEIIPYFKEGFDAVYLKDVSAEEKAAVSQKAGDICLRNPVTGDEIEYVDQLLATRTVEVALSYLAFGSASWAFFRPCACCARVRVTVAVVA